MEYSLEKIDSVDGYDALLMQAHKKRRDLGRKQRNLGEAIDAFRERMARIENALTEVHTSLAALRPAFQAMPECKDKATLLVMIKRLELRQARLEKMAYTCNVAALLVKEMKYNVLESQVLTLDDYIDTLEHARAAMDEPAVYLNHAEDFSRAPLAQRTPRAMGAVRREKYPITPSLTRGRRKLLALTLQTQHPAMQTAAQQVLG